MSDGERVVTAKMSGELVSRLDDACERIDRSKTWIVCEALRQWLADEQRRYELDNDAPSDRSASVESVSAG